MIDKIETTPDEILEIHRYGQKQGFMAGVIACLAVRYLYIRRSRYQAALAEARRDRIH